MRIGLPDRTTACAAVRVTTPVAVPAGARRASLG